MGYHLNTFLLNTVLGTEQKGCAQSPGGVVDDLVSCKTGKTAASNYFIFRPGVTDSATYGAAFQHTGAAWRLSGLLTCNHGGCKWPVHLWLINRAAYAHAGKPVVQFYTSTVALPTAAQMTAILASPNQGTLLTFAATAGQALEAFWAIDVPAVSFSAHYLWIVVNWLITTAGGNANAGVKLRVNGVNGSFVDVV